MSSARRQAPRRRCASSTGSARAESATIVNRGGFSAWIGGAGWAGLERGSRYLFTVEAVRRLVATRDQVVKSTRWSPGTGIATMWQTLVNSATFGRNVVARDLRADRWPSPGSDESTGR